MIYYEKYGNEFNPVVILLHDSESVYCFSKECDYLSRNYCAIVPHLPGFGRNPEKMFSAESALEQTAELAASFGKPVTLVGASLGAELAFHLICKNTELFNGCIMISPWLEKDIGSIEKALAQLNEREKVIKNKLLSGISGLTMGLSKDELRDYNDFCKNVSMNSLVAAVDNGISYEKYPEYKELKMPLLALCGLSESMEIRNSVRRLSKDNPNCSYDMWDGVSKKLPIKAAARLSKVIEEFIDKAYAK